MKNYFSFGSILVLALLFTTGPIQITHARSVTQSQTKEVSTMIEHLSKRMDRMAKEADRGKTSENNMRQMGRDMTTTAKLLEKISLMIHDGQMTPALSHRQVVELRAMMNKLGE